MKLGQTGMCPALVANMGAVCAYVPCDDMQSWSPFLLEAERAVGSGPGSAHMTATARCSHASSLLIEQCSCTPLLHSCTHWRSMVSCKRAELQQPQPCKIPC